ncbi:hypothetical protein BGZ57DRAFT_419290 [Hyaloscypha finlandica]|nr:hypothetical protein BGZ57DRAFT_419290 [Hyaloscypha finlandica]
MVTINGSLLRRNPTPEEITSIAQNLIKYNATTFLIDNYQSICKNWTSLLERTPPVGMGSSATTSILAAQLDVVRSIIMNRETPPLMLRLAYVKFVRVMEDLEDAAAAERLAGREPRERGRRDASIAIDYYLTFKGVASDNAFSRTQVSRCMDIGRRWYSLEGLSPLLLCAYSDVADEIVYVLLLLTYCST